MFLDLTLTNDNEDLIKPNIEKKDLRWHRDLQIIGE